MRGSAEDSGHYSLSELLILPPKIFARHRWKSLEFSKEPLNIRYDEAGRRRDCHGRKNPTA
jgi:hypothetical protein